MPNSAVEPALDEPERRSHGKPERGLWRLLGPAFVASIAYVDPGNVAANLTAGAEYGYLLVWVLVVSNAMAVLIQYLSAKLGLVTGRSLPQLLGARLTTKTRIAFWLQAEVVAAATDVAEVVGGAIALNLLFGLPLVWGGLITGVISMALLTIHARKGQQPFEGVIIGFLAIIAVGFVAGLFVSPVDAGAALGGLVPGFAGSATVVLAASMLGATVMPHAIYLHSSLSRDRHLPLLGADGMPRDPAEAQGGARETSQAGSGLPGGPVDRTEDHDARLPRLLRATKVDVFWSLVIAGSVNIAMLVLAAASLRGVGGTDTIAGAHDALGDALGPVVAMIFAIGLLASGLAASSVGAYAGAVIMGGLIHRRFPLALRRAITLIPALVVLAVGFDPTRALVLSQVVLSLGIPFALVPLVLLTSSRGVMGSHVTRVPLRIASWVVVALVVALNVALLAITVAGV